MAYLKQAGGYYAGYIMRDYECPQDGVPNEKTRDLESFMSHKLNSEDYNQVENFFRQYLNTQPFNRRQIRSIAQYAQEFARYIRDHYYCSLAVQGRI